MNAGKLTAPLEMNETTALAHKEKISKAISFYIYRLMEVLDKGKAAAVTTIVETRDKRNGKIIFENQMTVFIRGAGGFGGRRAGKGAFDIFNQRLTNFKIFHLLFNIDRGTASAPNVPPQRVPDAVMEEKTSTSQAALYR